MTERPIDPLRVRLANLCLVAASLTLAPPAHAGAPAPAADCPPAGADSFESQMNVILTIPGLGTSSLDLEGPVTVVRSEPRLDGGLVAGLVLAVLARRGAKRTRRA